MFPYSDNLTAAGHSLGVMILVGLLTIINVPLFLDPTFHRLAVASLGFSPLQFSMHPWATLYNLVTSVVLHGDIFHLAGNCLFLVVFGRSLERLFGMPIFLAAFPLLGIAGLLVHWALYPTSNAPVIGASGAIAAMMGGYLALFPSARIRMIVFLGYVWKRFTLPAWAFLGYWGGLQFFSVVLGSQDGVAYAVHVGSFVAGVIAAIIWKTSYPLAEEQLTEFTKTSFS